MLVFDTRAPALRAAATSTRHSTKSDKRRKRKAMTEAESPADPLGRSSAFTVTLPFLLSVSVLYSITLSHLVDDAFAYLSHVAAFVPTREIIVKE